MGSEAREGMVRGSARMRNVRDGRMVDGHADGRGCVPPFVRQRGLGDDWNTPLHSCERRAHCVVR
jgi:hypothetical protein